MFFQVSLAPFQQWHAAPKGNRPKSKCGLEHVLGQSQYAIQSSRQLLIHQLHECQQWWPLPYSNAMPDLSFSVPFKCALSLAMAAFFLVGKCSGTRVAWHVWNSCGKLAASFLGVSKCMCDLQKQSLSFLQPSYKSYWFSDQLRRFFSVSCPTLQSSIYGSDSTPQGRSLSPCNPLLF